MPLPGTEVLIVTGAGVLFIILAILAVIWGKLEEKHYYNSLVTRMDMREYVSHWPPRPSIGALQTGGWIGLAIGIILLAIGIYFWLV